MTSYTYEIVPDEDPISPRDPHYAEPFGTMICFHKRYRLGDKHELRSDQFSGWDAMREHLEKELSAAVILPLHLYDHSGITMSTSPFSCPWDSGQVGFIYVTREKILKEYSKKVLTKALREKATLLLDAEVKVYDAYISGDAHGYVVKDESGEVIDSCWGYLGDREAARHDAENMVALLVQKQRSCASNG